MLQFSGQGHFFCIFDQCLSLIDTPRQHLGIEVLIQILQLLVLLKVRGPSQNMNISIHLKRHCILHDSCNMEWKHYYIEVFQYRIKNDGGLGFIGFFSQHVYMMGILRTGDLLNSRKKKMLRKFPSKVWKKEYHAACAVSFH